MVGVSFVKGVSGHLLQPWKKICKQWVLCIVKLPIVDCDISTATVLIWGSSITIHYIRYLAQQLAAFHVFDPLTSKIGEKIITTSHIAKIFQTRGSTLSHLGYLLDCPVDIHKMLQNSDLSFKSALLIPSILMNAVHSTNLFLCYSHYHVPTNTIALFLGICLQTIHNPHFLFSLW